MIIVCMFMILMHIIEDFHLQGIMANMKQQRWWIDTLAEYSANHPDMHITGEDVKNTYRDYQVVLALHGFEWSMFIHIPLIVLYVSIYGFNIYDMIWLWMSILILVQGAIHSYIDDLKANRWAINLVQDQTMHLIQIAVSCILFGVMI